MAPATYDHNCFYCVKCIVLINVDYTHAGALPIADGEQMPCSSCGKMLTAQKQASWMNSMCMAQAVPWDDDRKAKCSDYMLNNPRPEMSEQAKFRVSMNAFKTGMHGKKHRFPPARPGKYEHCKLCEYASPDFHEFREGDGSCAEGVKNKTWSYCVKQAGHFARWINASAEGKTEEIKQIVGDIQSHLVLIAMNAADRIAIEGIMKELVTRKYTKGELVEEEVNDIVLSPYFKAIMEISDRLNLKLENFLLTPKSVSDKQVAETTADHIARLLSSRTSPILDNPNDE